MKHTSNYNSFSQTTSKHRAYCVAIQNQLLITLQLIDSS